MQWFKQISVKEYDDLIKNKKIKFIILHHILRAPNY